MKLPGRRLILTCPISELKRFPPIHLQGGESRKADFANGFNELSFYDAGMKRLVEPGRFEVMIGGSSAHLEKADLEVAAR